MNTLLHKKLIVIKFYYPKCYTLISDASVTITKNKSTELITENESIEAITENEIAENYPLVKMLADLKYQNIIYSPDSSREGKEMKENQPIIHTLRESLGKTTEVFYLRGRKRKLVTLRRS